MSRRGAGIALIAIAAFLYSVHYLSAAIFGSGVVSWDSELFNLMLQYVGPNLNYAAVTALIAGIAYLIWGELIDWRER